MQVYLQLDDQGRGTDDRLLFQPDAERPEGQAVPRGSGPRVPHHPGAPVGGEQFDPSFLSISPNGKIPAIVDHAPHGDPRPLPVFESGAILLYLAQKTGRLLPDDSRMRMEVLQWLFWQVSALGPMAGQAGYFRVYAANPPIQAIERYTQEVRRPYGVLDRRLDGRQYIGGLQYSIADIACYPWIVPHAPHGQRLHEFPNLARWFESVADRPATRRVYDGVQDVYAVPGKPVAQARAREHVHVLAARFARGLRVVIPSKEEGAGNAGCALHPRSRVQ